MTGAILLAFACISAGARADDWADCQSTMDMSRIVSGCSKFLSSTPANDPNRWAAYVNRCGAFIRLGKFANAVEDCTVAIELNPRYSNAHFNRGFAYRRLNKLPQAIQDYSRAIELKTDDHVAYSDRGIAYAMSGQLEQALKDFSAAIALRPDYVNATSVDPAQASTVTRKAPPSRTNCARLRAFDSHHCAISSRVAIHTAGRRPRASRNRSRSASRKKSMRSG
jgi:tetratricopeptide (TPR) repeat protein